MTDMTELQLFAGKVVQWGALLFVFLCGVLLLSVVVMYIVDVTQTKHTIRRNYPVVGRFRYFFEHLGEFFRQYFFAMDREELPFNRAERSWAYRAAKQVDTTVAFGSTRPFNNEGDVVFLNDPFPTLDGDATHTRPVTIGEGFAANPYQQNHIVHISGMSYGAISKPAVQALSHGAKEAGIWLNTGEGGLSKFHLEGGCDIVYQIGTAKYGVRDKNGALSDEKLRVIAEHKQVRMFEIKMSQGAKPGKGGILPGVKVSKEIADIRGIPEGEDSISPNGHPDIQSVDDLLDMIVRVRKVTGRPVGFKAVVGTLEFYHTLCQRIKERGLESAPDFITIDSGNGGTGAAPQPLMDFVGMFLDESLPLIIDILCQYDLRDRVKVVASGKLITPAKVAWALCAGADFVTSARGFMFALGCIQALQCNKNTCPTGITTHKAELQRGLVPERKSVRVANYAKELEHNVGMIAHSCGVKQPRALTRSHMRVLEDSGRTRLYSDIYPDVSVEEPSA